MKVVQINTVCGYGSTGKICVGISKVLNAQGIDNYILYSIGNSDYPYGIKCGEVFPQIQAMRSRVLGNYGFNSRRSTKRLIEELDRIGPDVVHLHNLHGHNCDLEMLMNYFRVNKTKLVWTFHDCWAFTAYCPHFVMAGCEKWRTGCHHCSQQRTFSWFFDRSRWLYEKKKQAFSDLDLTIVTPSRWLADIVKESFLKEYPVVVVNNGIDLSIFKPSESNFRKKYGIPQDKFLLLGVAIQWVPRKGADVFIRLAHRLDPDRFRIVMVGTDDKIDRKLPENIISIHRTTNQAELAQIYTAAELFVNPTQEDTFPTVNMESIACGTPVLTFRTGGSPECIDEKTGMVVDCDDEEALYQRILEIADRRPSSEADCIARAQHFDENKKFLEYAEIYEQLLRCDVSEKKEG